MIDTKSFMEFFEKKYGVQFVDVNTGKNVLDIINEKQVCEKCKHIIRGNGRILHTEDMVCGNPKSDNVTDFRTKDDTCELWEAEEKEGE